jgi:hypothetical protein
VVFGVMLGVSIVVLCLLYVGDGTGMCIGGIGVRPV